MIIFDGHSDYSYASPYPSNLVQDDGCSPEIYFVTGGSGIMMIEGAEQRVEAGDAIVIRPGERHSIRNDGLIELRLIVTCQPPWTPNCLIFD